MGVCKCCSNSVDIDGEDVVVKSRRALVALIGHDDKPTGKVGSGKVEIRITLTQEAARDLIADLAAAHNIIL